jgi:hypothetical protein
MVSLLAYSRHITLYTRNSASTQWSRDNTILYLHGRPIVLERFKEMVAGTLVKAENILWEELMFTSDPNGRFLIPLDKI